MATLNSAAADAVLKVLYDDQKMQKVTYTDRPFFAMVPKKENFGGRNYPLPLQYGNPQGRSATFATAQANKSSSSFTEFLLTRSKDYGLASIQNEMIDASKNDKEAFISLLENEVDSTIDSVANAISVDLFGNGSGSRGQLSSAQTLADTTWVLSDAEDIVKLEVNMKIVLSAAKGGGAVKSGAGYIVSVDRDAGTFEVSATLGGAPADVDVIVATAAASDYIFVEGDYDNKIKGLDAWIPDTAPGATAFFGVDRSADVTRLAGVRYDASSYTIEEGLQKGISRMVREGATPDKIIMNHEKLQDLILALGSKVQYIEHDIGKIGFRSVRIHGPKSIVDVFADKDCPFNRAYALTLKDWCFASLGKAPKLLTQDGNRILRENSDDACEVRVGYYGQLGCKAPGRSGVFLL